MYIPYGRQSIDEDDINSVVEVLKSDFITTGPKVTEFERKVADYVGAKYAVAVTNGTAALHMACLAIGIKEGDEVITTAITFAASANCVLYCGGTPVFADIDKDSYNINPDDIERKITKNTKAIIAVHYAGQPCDMDRIHEIAKKHNLYVIEDAAHALGATYKGRKIGSISDLTTFSFHPVKHITTGEGGMIVTNNEDFYEKMRLLSAHGITRDKDLLFNNEGQWYYEQQELGFNLRITDIQCALGISQMNKLNKFVDRRRKIAQRYSNELNDIEEIILPKQNNYANSSWHLYVIQIINKDRREIFDLLRKAQIGVNVHYIPVYRHPYYQKNGYKDVICKEAEKFYNRAISIPIYPDLSDEQQTYVIEQIKKVTL